MSKKKKIKHLQEETSSFRLDMTEIQHQMSTLQQDLSQMQHNYLTCRAEQVQNLQQGRYAQREVVAMQERLNKHLAYQDWFKQMAIAAMVLLAIFVTSSVYHNLSQANRQIVINYGDLNPAELQIAALREKLTDLEQSLAAIQSQANQAMPAVGEATAQPQDNVHWIEVSVQPGDSLGRLMERLNISQTSLGEILEKNQISNPNMLMVGQKIMLPVELLDKP